MRQKYFLHSLFHKTSTRELLQLALSCCDPSRSFQMQFTASLTDNADTPLSLQHLTRGSVQSLSALSSAFGLLSCRWFGEKPSEESAAIQNTWLQSFCTFKTLSFTCISKTVHCKLFIPKSMQRKLTWSTSKPHNTLQGRLWSGSFVQARVALKRKQGDHSDTTAVG